MRLRLGARSCRLARDYERLAETLARLHFVAFAILMAHRFASFMVQSAYQAREFHRIQGQRAGGDGFGHHRALYWQGCVYGRTG